MRRRTREQWRALVEEFEGSGLTQAEFARSCGLKLGTFRSWLYRFRRRAGSPEARLAEVMVADHDTDAGSYRLELPGDVVVVLGSAPEPRWLAALVAELVSVR